MAPSAVWVVRKQTRHESPQRGFWRPLRCPIDRSRPARTHGLRALQSWVLTGVVVQHLTVARIAQALGMSWNTAHTAVLGEGQRLLINDPTRFDGVRVIGVDEHVWRHTPHQDRYVTVILDVTPIRDRSGPSRLLDMVPGRSKQVFKTWLASQPDTWREHIEIVAMDGCCVPWIVESVLGRIGGLGRLASVSTRWSCVSVQRVWRWRLLLILLGARVLSSVLAASWGSILRRCIPGCVPWSRADARFDEQLSLKC